MATDNDRPDNSFEIPYQVGQDGTVTVSGTISSAGGTPNIDNLGATLNEPNWSAGASIQNNASGVTVSGGYSGISASLSSSPDSVSGQVQLSLENFTVNASSGPLGNSYGISFKTTF